MGFLNTVTPFAFYSTEQLCTCTQHRCQGNERPSEKWLLVLGKGSSVFGTPSALKAILRRKAAQSATGNDTCTGLKCDISLFLWLSVNPDAALEVEIRGQSTTNSWFLAKQVHVTAS